MVGIARIGVLGRTFASFAIPSILSRKARNPKGVRGRPALLAAAACAARTSMLSKNGSAASTRRSSAPRCAGENIAEYSEASRSHRRPSRAMRLRSIFNCCGVGRIDSLAMSLVACETQYAMTCRSIGFPSALSSLWSSASDNGRISGFGFARMNWSLAGDDGPFSELGRFVLKVIFCLRYRGARHEPVSPTSAVGWAPTAGLEPATRRLTAACSTN